MHAAALESKATRNEDQTETQLTVFFSKVVRQSRCFDVLRFGCFSVRHPIFEKKTVNWVSVWSSLCFALLSNAVACIANYVSWLLLPRVDSWISICFFQNAVAWIPESKTLATTQSNELSGPAVSRYRTIDCKCWYDWKNINNVASTANNSILNWRPGLTSETGRGFAMLASGRTCTFYDSNSQAGFFFVKTYISVERVLHAWPCNGNGNSSILKSFWKNT